LDIIEKDRELNEKLKNEIKIWEKLLHPNIIRLYETFYREKHIFFVQEICMAGDLLTYVRKRRILEERIAKYIMQQILKALHYLHSNNIIHRDIKLDNILLQQSGTIKICDFGVSKIVTHTESDEADTSGTPAYLPPEAVLGKTTNFARDMWSAGVVLYAMLHGIVPFRGKTENELGNAILKCEYKIREDLSPNSIDLLRSLLCVNPNHRLSALEALNHEWFNDCIEIPLFTEEEKLIIKNDFAKNDSEAINNEEIELEKSVNISAKSIVLAPFNSSNSYNFEENPMVYKEAPIVEKSALKLSPYVKDIDAKYERNYNCELDNGVYNAARKKYGDFECIGGMIPKKFISISGIGEKTVKRRIILINKLVGTENTKENMNKTVKIDMKTIDNMEKMGFERKYLIRSLENCERNHATTTYFLLQQE